MNSCDIVIVKKDVKNISIRVKPILKVLVTSPKHVSKKYLYELVERKKAWIEKKLEFFRKTKPEAKRYIDGEIFRFLGKGYKLKVVLSSKNKVFIEDEFLYLMIDDTKNIQKKAIMIENWYQDEAKKLFLNLVKKYQKIVKKEVHRVSIKSMKTRWGSCNHIKGYINLNLIMIEKPLEFIEYVVFHELAHLIYPNHSRDFYSYIQSYMPDWKKRKVMYLGEDF